MADVVRVEGLRELERALRASDKESLKALRKELREAGKVVALDARSRLASYDSKSAMGIRPRTQSGLTVLAEQTRRTVTGRRPDWGALIMQKALLPARSKHAGEVREAVEQAIDRVGKDNGF